MESLIVTFVAIGIAVAAVGVYWVATGRLFPRSVPLDHILAMIRVDDSAVAAGLESITQFYDWNQDRWGALAKGAGAAAVSVLLAVVGLVVAASQTATQVEETMAQTTTTIGTVAAKATPELIALVSLLAGLSLYSWLRSARGHLDFAEDLATISDMTEL